MRTKNKIAVLLLALVFALSFCAGCKKDGTETPPPDGENPPATEVSVSLDNPNITLLIDGTKKLNATTKGTASGGVTFESDKTDIASVDAAGTVTGIKPGNAVITAKFGTASATCNVTVEQGEHVPTLELEQITTDSVSVNMGETLDFSSSVTYNDKSYTDAAVNYTVNGGIGSVSSAGVFTPSKVGKGSVDISASWRGITGTTLNKSVAVTVQGAHEISVNDGATEITLYTTASWAGGTYDTEKDITVKVDGEAPADGSLNISVENGGEYVNYSSGKLTAVQHTESLTENLPRLKIVYTDAADQESVKYIPVKVMRPVATYSQTIEMFSALDGVIPVADIFGSADAEIVSAKDSDGNALTVGTDEDKNKIFGVQPDFVVDDDGHKTGVNNVEITVYGSAGGYKLTLQAYTLVIDSPEDLEYLNIKSIYEVREGISTASKEFIDSASVTGYYILFGNIDASRYTMQTHNGTPKGTGTECRFASLGAKSGSKDQLYVDYEAYKSVLGEPNVGDVRTAANGDRYVTVATGDYGFMGTLDGNGYAISGLSIQRQGLLGMIGKTGVVKNIAFNNVKFDNCNWMSNVLGSKIYSGAIIENVYVKMANMANSGGFIARTIEDGVVVKNSLFEISQRNSSSASGSFFGEYPSVAQNDGGSKFENVYVIASFALVDNATSANAYDASNIDGVADNKKISGVKRYESEEAMKGDTGNSYSNFEDSGCWDTSSGIPVWKSLQTA